MLTLVNLSSYRSMLFPGLNEKNQRQITCVVKEGYSFDHSGNISLLTNIEPIVIHDRHYNDDPKASLCAAEESMPYKQGSEIIVYGTAQTYLGECRTVDVRIKLFQQDKLVFQKELRIFGKRHWQMGLLGPMLSQPEILRPLSIRYEYAFGGQDPNNPQLICPYNPNGMGFGKSLRRLKQRQLPLIEQGPHYICKPVDEPYPAGFGPLARSYQPRLYDLVTCEDPSALSRRYNVAPLDQRFLAKFIGDEVISISGLIAGVLVDQEIKIKLPKATIFVKLKTAEQELALTLNCDTLILNTNLQTVHRISRCIIDWDYYCHKNGKVIVSEKPI